MELGSVHIVMKREPLKTCVGNRWISIFIILACIWLLGALRLPADPAEYAKLPSLISSLKAVDAVSFCGEAVPLDIPEVRERFEKEMLLSLWNRPQVILWLKRSTRYLPPIDEMLRKHGMPVDLKYVAVAESALLPHAGSSKGAIGFWQFISQTGRRYGLTINRRIDERRNIFTSTAAAIRYFQKLYADFGSWTLATAAYNMGEEALMTEITEQNIRDYYRLYLPLETQRFLFRIVAVKLILQDPGRYGFDLAKGDYYPRLAFERIQLQCDEETPVRVVAKAAGTHFKEIKDLNPQIRGHYMSKGVHTLLIPEGTSRGFHARFDRGMTQFLATQREKVYIVKRGDSLSGIADRFGVPLSILVMRNRLDVNRPIHPGDRIVIYTAR